MGGLLRPRADNWTDLQRTMNLEAGVVLAVLGWYVWYWQSGKPSLDVALVLLALACGVLCLVVALSLTLPPTLTAAAQVLLSLAGICLAHAWLGYAVAPAYLALPILLAAVQLPSGWATLLSLVAAVWLARGTDGPAGGAYAPLLLLLGVTADLLAWHLRDAMVNAWRDAEQGANLAREVRARQEEVNRLNKMLQMSNYLLKRSNHELAVTRLEAEEARHAKERFATSVSHELRTPLNIILGFTEVMQRFPEVYGEFVWPALLRHDIAEMQHSARYLSDLVDDVLDLARVEALRLPLRREWVRLPDLLADSADVVRRLLASKPVQMLVDCPADLPHLLIDRTRVRQVLLNLLANASRFTESGSITAGARISGDEIEVHVSDTGSGMAPEHLEHVFEEFSPDADTGPGQNGRLGKGLGLTIAKRFVQMHGGRIWAKSQVGVGTTFYFSLPLQAKQVMPAVLPDIAGVPRSPDGRMSLVVIDADKSAAAYLTRWLDGVTVWSAADLPEARALVLSRHPLAVLVNVPTGEQFDSYVNTVVAGLGDAVPVIRCTLPVGSWLLDDHLFEAWLVKPISAVALGEALGKLGEWRSVLIVDDDRGFAQLVRRLLRALSPNCEVAWASTAQQALARLADDPWDVMLVDISLPDMDGRGLARMVRDGAVAANGDLAYSGSGHGVPHIFALSGLQPGEGRGQPASTLFSLSVRSGLHERELLALLGGSLRAAASVHPEPEPLGAGTVSD